MRKYSIQNILYYENNYNLNHFKLIVRIYMCFVWKHWYMGEKILLCDCGWENQSLGHWLINDSITN